MAALTAVLAGAGQRGHHEYGRWARDHPALLRFVAVIEPDDEHRARFVAAHSLGDAMAVSSFADLPEGVVEAFFIASPDRSHHGHAVAALDSGYHVFLEKPMAATVEDCADLARRSRSAATVTAVAHTLRTTPFFRALRDVVRSGRLGDIITVEHRTSRPGTWPTASCGATGPWPPRLPR